MEISVSDALQDSLERLADEIVLAVLGGYVLFNLANMFVSQTFGKALNEAIFRMMGFSQQEMREMQRQSASGGFGAGAAQPFALDLSLPVAVLLVLVFALIAELLTVLAIRAFANDSDDPFPVDDLTENLGSVYLRSLAASLAAFVLVTIGLVLFVIPGLILVVAFYFVRQRAVLGGDGPLSALMNSFEFVKESPIRVVALILIAFAVGAGLTGPFTFLSVLSPAVSTTITTLLGALVGMYAIGLSTVAYQQLEGNVDVAN